MPLPLHVLPCSPYDDKLKKSFIYQLSLHVDIHRELSPTVSPPIIVIFRPQGRPNDEFDGVVQPFLGKYKMCCNSNCRNIILFTAFATSHRYGRGFTPDCVSHFKYTDKLFITSGHLDTQVNKSTFERLGAILVNEYEFKDTDDQSQLGHSTGSDAISHVDKGESTGSDADSQVDKGASTGSDADSQVDKGKSTGSDANSQVDKGESTGSDADSQVDKGESAGSDADSQVDKGKSEGSDADSQVERDHSTGRDVDQKHSIRSDANIQVDNAHSTRKDANSQAGKAHFTVRDATGQLDNGSSDPNSESGIICNLGDINRLRGMRQEMEIETTALQGKVEKKFALQPGNLLRILEAVMEHLDHRQEAAATSEIGERCKFQMEVSDQGTPSLLGDDVASKIEKQLKLDKGSVNEIISSLLEVRQRIGVFGNVLGKLDNARKWVMQKVSRKT